MSDSMADAIARYAEIKRQISELESELEAIKESVLLAVQAEGGQAAREQFVIQVNQRPKYKFSADYDQKNAELKTLRKAEIENGIATLEGNTEFVTIRFKDRSPE